MQHLALEGAEDILELPLLVWKWGGDPAPGPCPEAWQGGRTAGGAEVRLVGRPDVGQN